MSLAGDLVGRVFDGDFGFPNRFLDVALGCLFGTLRAEPIVADRLANTLLYLAYGFVGMPLDLAGCAAQCHPLGVDFALECVAKRPLRIVTNRDSSG